MTGAKADKTASAAGSGFTLLEVLVVLGLFSVAVVIAADIFMISNRVQRKTLNMERIESDARYVMEMIVREVRTGAIDYPWYDDNGIELATAEAGFVETLAVVDAQGERIVFRKSVGPEECASSDSQSCLLVSINDGSFQVITPRGVNVFRSAFYIRPVGDPYHFNTQTGLFDADSQPRVTVSLAVETTSTDPRDRSVLYLQTTVETRNFRR